MAFEYNLIFFFLLVMSIWQLFQKEFKINKPAFYLAVFLLILLTGLRDSIGPDWKAYKYAYEISKPEYNYSFQRILRFTGMEVGYITLGIIVSSLGLSISVFYLVLAFGAVFFKSYTILKYCRFVFLGLAVYYVPSFFISDIIQIRQGFAIGVAIFSVKFIIEKRIYYFLATIILASTFHFSVIVFIPAYWLARMNLSEIQMLVILIISIILSQFEVISFLTPLANLFEISQIEKGVSYLETDFSQRVGFTFGDVSKIIFAILMIQYKKYVINIEPTFKYFMNILFVGIVLYYSFRSNHIFFTRIPAYYLSFEYITIPMLIYSIRDKRIDFRILSLGYIAYLVLLYIRFEFLHADDFGNYFNILYNLNPANYDN